MTDVDRLMWKNEEDITKWIFIWSKLKTAILTKYRTNEATTEQDFLTRTRQPSESFLVYSVELEYLYRQAFKVEPGTALSNPSKKAIPRQFLRWIPQPIS
ncbi:Hypothetical predicted protein [Paramuricea clavata]|uniref:Uncharacterized protein n=1 Tax=Paramuricea clavata TaxID=317549 RepID=A0A7D9HRU0_PARCT|nr:Hypothetical predicted protein [Paramuricea clavata]